MSTVKARAYIPSAAEYDLLKEKFPGFAGPKATKKALDAGVQTGANWIDQSCFVLRTPVPRYFETEGYSIYMGYITGERKPTFTSTETNGLVVAINLIYDPNSSVVQNCKTKYSWSYVSSDRKGKVTEESEAPIVTFGGIEYIWLNKEECEQGNAHFMHLISRYVLDKAPQFSEDGSHNDYAQATDIHEKCESIAFENATEEEMALVVEAEMSDEDGYDKISFNLTPEQVARLHHEENNYNK